MVPIEANLHRNLKVCLTPSFAMLQRISGDVSHVIHCVYRVTQLCNSHSKVPIAAFRSSWQVQLAKLGSCKYVFGFAAVAASSSWPCTCQVLFRSYLD
jgi:hypothetical protein